jgi:peptide/nickel transport system substrate-binding protein
VFALLGPAATPATKHPRYGGTLRIELSSASVSLDPRTWKAGSEAAAESLKFAALVYDRLVTLDDYGRFQPDLALEWSHDAAFKTWQFKLRPGVKFSDGVPLTPKEVVSALQPLLPSGLQIAPIEGGVQIRATNPAPDLLEQLSSGRYFIFRARPDNPFAGTGPFQLVESVLAAPAEANPSVLRPGRLKFRAREDVWSGRPFVDAIEVTLGNPPLREVLDLQVGRVDVIDIPPDLVRKARQENLRVWSSPPDTLLALRWDDAQPAASDPHFREALDLSLDRDTMANVLLQRQALPASALLPQWLSGYAFLFGSSMNLDRAKALRASVPASVPGGAEPVRLRVDAVGDLMKLLGERVAVNARQANISVQLVPHATSSVSNAPNSALVGLHLFAWHYDSLSPRVELQALAQQMHADKTTKPEPGDELTNPERLYAGERRLLDEREVLPLLLIPEYVGIAPNIRNWSADPSGAWRLAEVWLEVAEPVTSGAEEAPKGRTPALGVHP